VAQPRRLLVLPFVTLGCDWSAGPGQVVCLQSCWSSQLVLDVCSVRSVLQYDL